MNMNQARERGRRKGVIGLRGNVGTKLTLSEGTYVFYASKQLAPSLHLLFQKQTDRRRQVSYIPHQRRSKGLLLLFSCSALSDSFAASWTVACQAPLSMGFPRQEYWSRLAFPSPGDLSNPGIEHTSPALAGGFFTTEPGKLRSKRWWLKIGELVRLFLMCIL